MDHLTLSFLQSCRRYPSVTVVLDVAGGRAGRITSELRAAFDRRYQEVVRRLDREPDLDPGDVSRTLAGLVRAANAVVLEPSTTAVVLFASGDVSQWVPLTVAVR